MSSPFAALACEPGLPDVFRATLLGDGAVLEGAMDRVWRRRPLLRPIFSLLACFDGLFPETGTGVPARLEIESSGEGQMWRRTFAFERTRRFDAEIGHDGVLGLVERVGPLAMPWTMRFRAPDTLEIESSSAYLCAGRRRIRLPRALTPSVRVVERAIADDAVHVELVLSHAVAGPLFGYSGTFRVRPR